MVGQWRNGFPKNVPKNRSRKLQAIFGLPFSWLVNGEKYFPKTPPNLQVAFMRPFFASGFHHWPMAKNISQKRSEK
jgi:hypothetical protein